MANNAFGDHGNGVTITTLTGDTTVCNNDSIRLAATNVGYYAYSSGISVDDGYSGIIPIGFTFKFYGREYTKCVISSNGFITFDSSMAGGSSPWSISSGVPGNTNCPNAVMGIYADLYLPAGGIATYGVAGTAPNRRFVVNFCTTPMYSCTSLTSSFQIILYETSNVAEVHIHHKEDCTTWNGGYGIEGVQDSTCTHATVAPGRNYPSVWSITAPEGRRFTPVAGDTVYTCDTIPYNPISQDSSAIYWYAGSTYLGTGGTMMVYPTDTTVYTAMSVSCSDTSSSLRTVNVILTNQGVISGANEVCVGYNTTLTDTVHGGTWSSSNTSIATVSSGGVVHGVTSGTVTISYGVTSTCGGTTYATHTVTVGIITSAITGGTLICGSAVDTLRDSTSGGVWSCTPTTVATIASSTGIMHGVSSGTVTVSYYLSSTCGTGLATYTVTVSAIPSVAAITGPTSGSVDSSITLTETTTGGTWSSTNTTVSSVNTSGIVYESSIGIDTIKYTVTNSCGTTVVSHVDTVTTNPAVSCGNITTIVGNGTGAFAGDGGTATSSEIYRPWGVAIDGNGNLYVADDYNVRVRKITPAGIISTFAGTGTSSYSGDGGPATAATFNSIASIAVDAANNVYIADEGNHRIRKIATSGIVTTVAGNGTGGFAGDGSAATAASLNFPTGVALDAAGNIYIADYSNQRVRKVTASGIISTIAGTGTAGYSGDGAAATAAQLNQPLNIAVGPSGSVFISDNGNFRVRKINTSGIITTAIGTGSPGFSGDGGAATAAAIYGTYGITTDRSGNIYLGDNGNNRIRKITAAGVISTIAGDGTGGFAGDGGAATAAEIYNPIGVAVDTLGNVYIADNYNNRIRKVNFAGPVVAAISGPASVCQASTITLTDATSGGTWSSANIAVATVSSTGVVGGVTMGTTNISYTLTNGCGSTTVTQAVTVTGPPATAGVISGSTSVCPGVFVALTDSTAGGTWTSTNTSIATVNATGNVYGVSSGVDSIHYTVSNSCGTVYSAYAVTVLAAPISGSISGAASVCVGASTSLTDGVLGGTWTSSSTGVATVNSSGTVYGVAVGTAIITYTVTNSCGSAYQVKTITVSTIPAVPGTIGGAASVCTSATITLTDGTSGGAWTSSNSSIATVGSTGIVTGVASGAATITYTVTNTCGSAYTTKSITVNAGPTVAAISGATSVCAGASTMLTDATSGGVWTSGNTAVATVGSTGTVYGVAAGTATISYSVTATCGTVVATYTVTVIALPTVGAISGASSLCNGTNTTLTDGTSGGVWTSGTTSVATVNATGTVYAVSAGTTNITYTLTTSCGTASATKAVSVTALPTAGTISGGTTVCAGSATTLTDGVSGGTWSSSNSAVASVSASGTVTGIAAGTAVISYTVTSTCGTVMTSTAVTVNPLPNAGTLTGSATVCTGTTTNLTNTAGGGTWSSSATAIATVSSAGVVTGVTAGTVVISYSVTNSCGTAVATHAMTVSLSATVGAISGPSTVCAGSSITLSDGTSGGTWSSANTSVATVSAGVVHGIAAGSVAISYSVSTSCGTATAGYVITVSALPSAGTISGASTVCTGATTTLTDAAAGGVWSSSATTKATVSSTGVVTGVSSGSVVISYTVASSCATAVATSTLTVSASASAGTITGLGTVCTGNNITLTATGTAGGAWTSSAPTIATVAAGVVHGISAGIVTISYAVTSACGTVYATKSVTVSATPTVTAISGATNLCIGTASTYTDGTAGGGWISSSTAVATVNSSGVLTGISAGTITLTYFVTNTCGTATTTKSVTVNTLTAGVVSGAASVAVGASTTLTNTVTGGVWSSARTAIATINTAGSVTGVAIGTDTIKYTVTNVCGSAVATKVMTITAHRDELPGSGAAQPEGEPDINVYPNPNTGTFTLELPATTGTATAIITDMSGKTIETRQTDDKIVTFDMSVHAAGVYILRVDVDGKVYTKKVVMN